MNPINIALFKGEVSFFLGYFPSKATNLRKEPLKMIFSTIFVVRWKCVNLVKLGYIK